MVGCVRAHGLMTHPPTRQFTAWQDGQGQSAGGGVRRMAEYCPHCMNRGGVCGTSQTDADRNYNKPTDSSGRVLSPPPIMATYEAGETIDVEFSITAHHRGHVELRICKQWDRLTQQCFDQYPLEFVEDAFYGAPRDPRNPQRGYIAPNDGEAYPPGTTDIPLGNGMPFKMRFKIPEAVGQCDHCVLQWVYVTANTCLVDGYRTYRFPTSQWWADYLQDCEKLTGSKRYIDTLENLPEKFWNCADVQIAAPGRGTTTAPPRSPGRPAAQPESEEVHDGGVEPKAFEVSKPAQTEAANEADRSEPASPGRVEKWGQCGDAGGKHSECADAGFSCKKGNDWYWQCRETDEAPPPPPRADGSVEDWGQCGDAGGQHSECAGRRFTCQKGNDWYWQCRPGSSGSGGRRGGRRQEAVQSMAASNGVADWGQCGGRNMCNDRDEACKECKSPSYTCRKGNPWYYQCVPK